MLKFTEQVKLKQCGKLVILYHGIDAAAKSFFVYFLSDARQVAMMREDYVNNTARVITEYGEMLYSDYLPAPDEKAVNFLNNWIAESGGSHI